MGFKASEHDGDDDRIEVGEDWVAAPESYQRSQRDQLHDLAQGQAQLDAAISARNRRLTERARLTRRNEEEQVEDRATERQSRPREESRKTWTFRLAWYGAIVATLALLVGVAAAVMTGIVLSRTPEPVAPPIAPGLEQPAPRLPSVVPAPSTPAPAVEPSLAPPG